MPTYDYRCAANGQVLEVQHRMSEQANNWGELCAFAGIAIGDTPHDTPVERLATGGSLVSSNSLKNPDLPPCAAGGGCPSGGCGI